MKTTTDRPVRTLLVLIMLLSVILAGILLSELRPADDTYLSLMLTAAPEPTPVPTPEPTPEPTTEPTPSPTPEPTPDPAVLELEALRERQESEIEFLTLVNPWYPIDESYVPELIMVSNDQSVDVRCYYDLSMMLQDCHADGNDPFLCSGYRTMEYQTHLFQNKIYRLIAEGVEKDKAPAIAAKSVALPGTSEHQLGLAVDLIDYWYPDLNESQEDTSTQQWLMENCWKYGFILRYPNGTTDITGIIYEPWHYRYVGHIAAEEITARGITLEEYLELLYPDKY